jgi:hypothetical protein
MRVYYQFSHLILEISRVKWPAESNGQQSPLMVPSDRIPYPRAQVEIRAVNGANRPMPKDQVISSGVK